MQDLQTTERTRLKRLPKRASYDRAVINPILDEAMFSHVAFVAGGQPYAIPTLHVRIGDRLYIHGSAASRMLRVAAEGVDICVTATLMDGLVLARSAFHHSMNYRAVMILGKATALENAEEKNQVLKALVDKIVPRRWDSVRWPTEQELSATSVLSVPIEEGSAKVRTGGPIDDEDDLSIPVWAGVIPLRTESLAPIPERDLAPSMAIPEHVAEYLTPAQRAGGVAHDGVPFEMHAGNVLISTDSARIDLGVVQSFLTSSYWAEGVTRAVMAKAIANSLCFGAYDGDSQIGLARVVTDYATFAYVADVFVLEKYRG